ncbi:MAG TPA: hypothetical protein VGM54_15235 [Chthoniobacter sp.]
MPFTLETARAELLAKVIKAGAKGANSPVTAATKEPKRSLFTQALETLEAEGKIYVDRSKTKPKYLSIEYAPSIEGAATRMEQLAARLHPALLTLPELKKALSKSELAMAGEALIALETDRRLVRLLRKSSAVYACGNSLRAMLGIDSQRQLPPVELPSREISGEAIRRTYGDLVRLTGFPDVQISTLQHHAGVPMDALKGWLLTEHQNRRAIFSTGDWSLANDAVRAGVIDMRGERYLLVRLEV